MKQRMSDGVFLYAYDNRMCYFNAVIENVLINLYAFMGTNTERNLENVNTFNSAPFRVRISNTDTEIKIGHFTLTDTNKSQHCNE